MATNLGTYTIRRKPGRPNQRMLHLPVGWRMDVRPGDQVELLADGSDLIVVPVEKRARTSK